MRTSAWVGIRPLLSRSAPGPRTAARTAPPTSGTAAAPSCLTSSSASRIARFRSSTRDSPISLSSASRISAASTERSSALVIITRLSTRMALLSISAVSSDTNLAREVRAREVRPSAGNQPQGRRPGRSSTLMSGHLCSPVPSIRSHWVQVRGPRGLLQHHHPSPRPFDQLGVMFTRVIDDHRRDGGGNRGMRAHAPRGARSARRRFGRGSARQAPSDRITRVIIGPPGPNRGDGQRCWGLDVTACTAASSEQNWEHATHAPRDARKEDRT